MDTRRGALSRLILVLAAGLVVAPAAGAQLVIQLRSGNGLAGTQDPDVSFLAGPPDLPFDHAFNDGDFDAAKSGPAAFIIPAQPGWLSSLPSDAAARWITTGAVGSGLDGYSALFAIPFDVPETTVFSATLDFYFAVDNRLAFAPNDGLFINGIGLPNTLYFYDDAFTAEHAFLNLDVTSMLHSGENTLYVNAVDLGLWGGLIFSATLTLDADIGSWSDVGSSLTGSSGAPTLTGTGYLLDGSPTAFSLALAKPFSFAPLVVGISDISAPFKGGVMVPSPDFIFPAFTDFFGSATFGGLWPAGVPSGFTTYFQWWVQDPAGPKGFAASNALAGTTP